MLIAYTANGRHAGKSTATDFTMEWARQMFFEHQRLAFGDKMKILVANALGIQSINVNHPDACADPIPDVDLFKEDGLVHVRKHRATSGYEVSGRDFIINIAEGARSLFGASFWTDQVLPPVTGESLELARQITAISDLRFPEEAERVHEYGGVVVKIERPEAETGRSEGMLPKEYVDLTLANDQSLNVFGFRVYQLCDMLCDQIHGEGWDPPIAPPEAPNAA